MKSAKPDIVHLTATGIYAGVLLCGKPREAGGRYIHAGYHEGNRDLVCQECLAYWDELNGA